MCLPLDNVIAKARAMTHNFEGKPTAKHFLDWADQQRTIFLQVPPPLSMKLSLSYAYVVRA